MTSGPVVGGTDRDALVALYNATGGTGWTNRANWLSGEPIGDWYGVTTDAAGRVTSLNLRSNNLTGSLPTEIGNLTALRFLYLYGNSGLTGPVPAEMANLTGLSSVYSFGTGLCLPPGLGSWHDALTVKSPMSSCTGAPPPTAQGPSFGTATVADRNWRRGEAIGAVALPAATGGVGALTYRLTPTLPSGLRFAPSTRVLSGTPTAAFPRTVFTLRATDGEGNAATLTFGIAGDVGSGRRRDGSRCAGGAVQRHRRHGLDEPGELAERRADRRLVRRDHGRGGPGDQPEPAEQQPDGFAADRDRQSDRAALPLPLRQ